MMNIHRYLWLIALGASMVLSGCKKDDPVEPEVFTGLRLTLAPMWDGAPFDRTAEYHNVMNYRVLMSQMKMYLAEMRLLGASGGSSVFEIDLFDFTNGPITHCYSTATGQFNGLGFGLGVPYAMNHSDPSTYANSHPLSVNNGMYWTWNVDYYRFMIFDGRFDTDPNGTGQTLPTFSIHTGLDTCYRTLQFNESITVVQDQATDVRIEFDLSRFFYSSNDTIDLAVDSQSHGNNVQLAIRLTDKAVAATSVQ